jgi:alpha-beta hydrolase superfamily lysophospholipase
MLKYLRWARSHRKTSLCLALLFAFALLNLLAYFHAHAMTCFGGAGAPTHKPESLTLLQKGKVLLFGVTIPRPSAGGVTPQSVDLPFEVHRIPTPDQGELEAWHVPHADARGLVLIFHGYAACKARLLPEARALYDLGYALLLVDFRGSGGSTGSTTTIGMREADDVTLSWAYAREHWGEQPLFLFGQSMGSAAVLRALAVGGVQPRAVVLECPFDTLLNTVANRFTIMGLPTFPAARLLVFWGGLQHGFNGFAHNPVDYAGKASCPVLLLHGEKDRNVTMEQAESIFHVLPGPKEMEVFQGVGHESYVVRQPDQWREVIARFLDRHTGPFVR